MLSLPPGMSARFKAGTKLAEACRDMGYPGFKNINSYSGALSGKRRGGGVDLNP